MLIARSRSRGPAPAEIDRGELGQRLGDCPVIVLLVAVEHPQADVGVACEEQAVQDLADHGFDPPFLLGGRPNPGKDLLLDVHTDRMRGPG